MKKKNNLRQSLANAATLVLALVAITACTVSTDDAPLVPPTGPGADPLAALPPNTPVGIAPVIATFGHTDAATRSTDTSPQALAAIPAYDEITATTPTVNPGDNSSAGKAIATLTPYGAVSDVQGIAGILFPEAGATLPNFAQAKLHYQENFSIYSLLNGDGILRLRHFNLNATGANGTAQPHGRSMEMSFSTNIDQLLGFGTLGRKADGTANTTPDVGIRLRHARAKVSLLLTDATTGTPVDVSLAPNNADAKLVSAAFGTKNTTGTLVYTGGGSSSHQDLSSYLSTKDANGNYPDAPSANHVAIAIPTSAASIANFNLLHPTATPDATPKHLLNGIVSASATHSDVSNGSYYTLLPSPEAYTADNYIALTLRTKVDGATPTPVNFRLPLTSIALTGLPQGDGRRDADKTDGSGHLLYLLPGEHLVVTARVDASDKHTITATAIIGQWDEAEAEEEVTDDETKVGPFNDVKFCAALESVYGFVLNAKGRVDVTNTENIAKFGSITELDLQSKDIANLDGIEYFTKLETLYCNKNQLTALDVSNNSELTWLDCNNNRLVALDASVISNTNANIYCGKQTTDGTTAQTLELTLRSTLKNRWEDSLKGDLDNAGTVNVTYVTVTP